MSGDSQMNLAHVRCSFRKAAEFVLNLSDKCPSVMLACSVMVVQSSGKIFPMMMDSKDVGGSHAAVQ